jgi:hypothetical protein
MRIVIMLIYFLFVHTTKFTSESDAMKLIF